MMMKMLFATGLALFAAAPVGYAADGVHPGEKVYQRCAACHLADGAGVPGAYPPLRESIVQLAATDRGRNYLSYVVLNGLNGALTVGDQTYRGFMPGVAAGLTDEDLANLLNYLVENIASPPSADIAFENFSAEEITARRKAVSTGHTHQSMLAARDEALAVSAEAIAIEVHEK